MPFYGVIYLSIKNQKVKLFRVNLTFTKEAFNTKKFLIQYNFTNLSSVGDFFMDLSDILRHFGELSIAKDKLITLALDNF